MLWATILHWSARVHDTSLGLTRSLFMRRMQLQWFFQFWKIQCHFFLLSIYYLQEWKSTIRQAPMELRWGFIYLMISLGPVVLIHFLCLNDSWDNCNFQFRTICTSDGSNYVQSSMFVRWKPKIGCSSSITDRWTCSMFEKTIF